MYAPVNILECWTAPAVLSLHIAEIFGSDAYCQSCWSMLLETSYLLCQIVAGPFGRYKEVSIVLHSFMDCSHFSSMNLSLGMHQVLFGETVGVVFPKVL
jgi:hypothetical protein